MKTDQPFLHTIMSDASPFTLIRTPDAQPASSGATPPANRGKVVLPTRRKMIPQATEPVAPLPPEEVIKDVVARVKKAAKAPPLERSPRPAKDERKKLPLSAEAQPIKGQNSHRDPQPGSTMLPPPRRVHAPVEAELEEPEIDPFETNEIAVQQLRIKKIAAVQENAAPVADIPLSPASIRRAQSAPAAPAPEKSALPLVPRQKPASNEFALKEESRPVLPAPAKKPKNSAQSVLPPSKSISNLNSPKEMSHWLESEEPAKIHTPRSDAPIVEMQLKSSEPALVSRNRLKFCCPACNHTISVPKKFAGHKTRCSQCASAIRAPHPKFHRGTYNYEQHIESILHPEAFELPPVARPKFLGIPMPDAHTSLIGSAAIMLLSAGTYFFNFKDGSGAALKEDQKVAAKPMAPSLEEEVRQENGFDAQRKAEELVKEYLTTDGWEGKAQFVREVERVAPLMKDYFERGHSAAAVQPKRVRSSAPSYYQGEQLKHRRSDVLADLPDGSEVRFVVEYLPEGAKIEWESSVAYSPAKWDDILAAEPSKKNPPQLMRVAACVDKYYNNEFSDDREYLSVYLQDPVTGEPLGNGYISRQSDDGVRLRRFLHGSSKNNPDRIIVEVRPVKDSQKDRVVEITRFVKSGFRHPESTALASTR